MQDTVWHLLFKSIKELIDFLEETTPKRVVINNHCDVKNIFEG